ncbi:MAG: ClpX C4-type zinc finger protein [Myxococcaceae bacterium]|nr:ClpX C4-type zinc finger protein [Myxococcaceae bacterium]
MAHLVDLLPRVHAEGHLVAQGHACIDSALRLSQMTERERWDVDLSRPRFEWREGEAVIFAGPCQLLGTWVEGDGFLWGHHNPSVPPSGWSALKPRLEAIEGVATLLDTRAFEVTKRDCALVMQWLAVRAGFTGCFAGAVGQATSYLAVTLDDGQGAGGWCSWCGSTRAMVRSLIAGPRGVMMCDRCGELVGDILAETGSRPGPPPAPMDVGTAPTLRFCVFCEQPRGGLIVGPHAGLCRDCGALVRDVLASRAS